MHLFDALSLNPPRWLQLVIYFPECPPKTCMNLLCIAVSYKMHIYVCKTQWSLDEWEQTRNSISLIKMQQPITLNYAVDILLIYRFSLRLTGESGSLLALGLL